MTTAAAEAAVVVPSPRSADGLVDGVVEVLPELPGLFVEEASQWLSTSAGRLAFDGYSWMQAVHWVAGSGLYQPRRHRNHGPRSFGGPTVRVAQELAHLFPCRPGVAHLMRVTGMSERTVEYHLQMLRETGLLAYVARGTRVRGGKGMASEFTLMIPPEFDAALGIRTVQRHNAAPDYVRAVAGISEAGRTLMAKLGKKATRKVRKPRKKPASTPSSKSPQSTPKEDTGTAGEAVQEPVDNPVSQDGRCTPMQSGCSAVPTAGSTPDPSEVKIASGDRKSPPRKRARRGPRKLNRTGQRFALAGELMRRVPWLRAASRDRIAWVVGEVSDAGWTADEVLACLDLRQAPPGGVRRASGFLAARMRGMAAMPGWTTPQQRRAQVDHRNTAVDAARKSRIQQVRDQQEHAEGSWQAPHSEAVRREVDQLLEQALQAPETDGQEEQAPATGQNAADLDAPAMRKAARIGLLAGDTSLIDGAVATLGLTAAENFYGPGLVARARQLSTLKRGTTHTGKARP